jgi:hypothetical protein
LGVSRRLPTFRAALVALVGAAVGVGADPASGRTAAPPERVIDQAAYQQRLRAMWLATCIANWTGLTTEGRRTGQVGGPPMLTDQQWGTFPFPEAPWSYVTFQLFQDPWGADDDTDIEYVYVDALHERGATRLSPDDLRDEWRRHINWAIWVSNATARQLMDRGIRPPMTAQAQGVAALPSGALSPDHALMIDAQLTTEIFGALAPGMPHRALEMADGPIRATAVGHAAHASQFHVALFSLATQVDTTLSGEAQALWLVEQARRFIPDASVASRVIDFVVADYLANPDKTDWESTRDKVRQRFQLDAEGQGMVYRAWYESKVNLATGVIALLYGQMDFARTVQIGTLSGWDSDNGTATMGGLIGLVQGPAFIRPSYNWPPLSDRFWTSRTRDALPDYLPADPSAEDTFTLIAARMMPIIDREVVGAGGRSGAGRWLLPPGGAAASAEDALLRSPTHRLMLRSANRAVAQAGGSVTPWVSAPGAAPGPNFGSADLSLIVNWTEHDFRGLERFGTPQMYATTHRAVPAPDTAQSVQVVYDRGVLALTVRFITGEVWTDGPVRGGWCASTPQLELLIDGVWTLVSATPSVVPGSGAPAIAPFTIIDFALPAPIACAGARVSCLPGGSGAFLTVCELDVLGPEAGPGIPGADLNADGRVDIDDLYAAYSTGGTPDLTGNGVIDERDRAYLGALVRFGELDAMSRPRP